MPTSVSSACTLLASLGAARTVLPLTSNLALISECSRGLIQNSILPLGLVTNRSSNSVYPTSLAARKNACNVEWWVSCLNPDLLLISTLQDENLSCRTYEWRRKSCCEYPECGLERAWWTGKLAGRNMSFAPRKTRLRGSILDAGCA